jgi:hypothetical protein
MDKTINLNGPETLKFDLNLKTMVGISKIPQEKLIKYLTHDNYKLSERVMEFRSMKIPSEPGILGLLDVTTPHLAVELVGGNNGSMIFPLGESFPQGHKVIAVYQDQVLIFYKQVSSNEHENCFVAEFIYWDDKYPPVDGLNLKTMVNVSRLTRWQLVKYLDHLERPLRGRKAIIHPMTISPLIKSTDDQQVEIVEDILTDVTVFDPSDSGEMDNVVQEKKEHLTDRSLRLPSSPLHFHLTAMVDCTTTQANGDVLIIYDKDGKKPEFMYWED